ncbi:hypothetical protein R3P38DRAFT_2881761 [Favolaschia claudopus]|uniref:Uncharacterized protein n=1 Tax=Favolaschia claudopus TaxID=2862362 RepID=A0AAW0CYE3_9AGAR
MAANESAFLYSEDELNELGVLDEGAPQLAKRALDLMRRRPDLLAPNKWALQCVMAVSVEKCAPAFYNEGHYSELIYRSPSTNPTAQSQHIVNSNSIYTADDTRLGKIWPTILDDIRLVVKAAVPSYSSLNACRRGPANPDFTFSSNPDLDDGKTDTGGLRPAVVCVGVPPGSISADTAHDVSQTILDLLLKHGVDDVVVEWREAVVSRLSG